MAVHQEVVTVWGEIVRLSRDALLPVTRAAGEESESLAQKLKSTLGRGSQTSTTRLDGFTVEYDSDGEIVEMYHDGQPFDESIVLEPDHAEQIIAEIHSLRSSLLDDPTDQRQILTTHLNVFREKLDRIPSDLSLDGLVEAVVEYHRPILSRTFATGRELPTLSDPSDETQPCAERFPAGCTTLEQLLGCRDKHVESCGDQFAIVSAHNEKSGDEKFVVGIDESTRDFFIGNFADGHCPDLDRAGTTDVFDALEHDDASVIRSVSR